MAMCFLANLSISLHVGYKQANPGLVLTHTAGLCLAVLPMGDSEHSGDSTKLCAHIVKLNCIV